MVNESGYDKYTCDTAKDVVPGAGVGTAYRKRSAKERVAVCLPVADKFTMEWLKGTRGLILA